MPVERVEEKRARLREDLVDRSDHEERADLPPLAALASEFDRELDHLLEGPPARSTAVRAFAHRPEGLLEELRARVRAHQTNETKRCPLLIRHPESSA